MTTKEQDQRPPLPGARHTESVLEQQRQLPGTLSPPPGPCHALGHAQAHQHMPLPAGARRAALPAAAWLLRQLHLGFGMYWRVHPVLPTQLDPAPISIPIILVSPSPPWTSDSSAGLSSYQPTPSSQPCSGLNLCSPHTYLLRSWGISSAPRTPSHQALSPPVCFASKGCAGVIRGCITSIFCPASSCFLPLFKAPGADWSCQPEPDIWGGEAKPTRTSLDGAAGRGHIQPEERQCHFSSSRVGKPPVPSGHLCHPAPVCPPPPGR